MSTTTRATASAAERKFARIATALLREPGVTVGGKGFGSSGLKYRGKLFAMISSKGLFVVKLPGERVDALVRAGHGTYFDPGHGRLMKQWVALTATTPSWASLAREA